MPNKITCPNCGEEIDIENLIQAGAKDALDKQLAAQKSALEKAKEEEIEAILKEQKIKQQEKEIELRKKILEEQDEANQALQKELAEKSEQVKELNKLKVEKARLEREKAELKDSIQAESEKEFNQRLVEEKQKLQKNAEEKFELQIAELKKQLADQMALTEEMKKRQEQGSMQLQGEVQELAIEKFLMENFRLDDIQEIKKGDMGADSVQIVNTTYRQNCGSIYYESKRTKTFQESWIAKFKDDIQTRGADIGVLVTAVYPKDMSRMGLKDGVYICSYEEFKALSGILREALIKISDTKSLQENKHEKSAVLYNYLTSTEFKFQIETIVNAFVSMQADLDAEKRAMNKIWKKREKEIQNVISATTDMYGSIQGIAGSAVKPVEALEFPLLEDNSEDITL